ncbi:MAG: hypothetical protein ACRD44_07825 [Bryobacteraceae bacterium]
MTISNDAEGRPEAGAAEPLGFVHPGRRPAAVTLRAVLAVLPGLGRRTLREIEHLTPSRWAAGRA